MSRLDQLPEVLHDENLTRAEKLLLVLYALEKPSLPAAIKQAARNAGLTEAAKWNISQILADARPLALNTNRGWELSSRGAAFAKKFFDTVPLASEDITVSGPGSDEDIPAETLDVFVSHSGRDVELAKRLVNLLVAAFNMHKSRIRCTSVPGCKLAAGADANRELAIDIKRSKALIGLLTEASVESSYVLFELGARWGRPQKIIPLLGPGASVDLLPPPIRPAHALRSNSRTDLQQMLDELAKDCGLTLRPAQDYEDQLTSLLKYRGAARSSPIRPSKGKR